MGEYDALFDEPAPQKPKATAAASPYDALFDDAPAQTPAPPVPPPQSSMLERAKTVAGRLADSVRGLGHNVAEGASEIVHRPLDAARDIGTGFMNGVGGIVGAVKSTGDTINQVAAHPIATLGDKRFRTEFMRGVNDNIPLANSAVEVLGGPPATSESDAAAFPNARAAGNVTGMALPVGKTLDATLEATGRGVRKVAGAVAEKAEDRMVDQAVKDIAGNKGTAISKPTDRRAIAKAIEPLKDELRQPGAIAIADTARKDPARAWEMVQDKVNDLTTGRKAAYDTIDNVTGGVALADLRSHLAGELKRLGKAPGFATERAAIEGVMKDIDETWGSNVAPTVPTIEMRRYVTRAQQVAADTMGGLEETRRFQVLNGVSRTLKDFLDAHLDTAAKVDPGVAQTVNELRDTNKRVAAWLSLEDALKTRSSKLETNRMVDSGPKSVAAGVAGAGAAMHYLHSPVAAASALAVGAAPYVLPAADRAITRGVQQLPGLLGAGGGASANAGAVARLLQAARAGATRAELEKQAQQDGTPPEIAANIAQQYGR